MGLVWATWEGLPPGWCVSHFSGCCMTGHRTLEEGKQSQSSRISLLWGEDNKELSYTIE
jgi:hypothetical protein